MKHFIRRLDRLRHAVAGNILMGVAGTVAGLIQASTLLMGAGIAWIIASTTILILTLMTSQPSEAEMVFIGQIAEKQQPQLPDVQMHMHCTPELSTVA